MARRQLKNVRGLYESLAGYLVEVQSFNVGERFGTERLLSLLKAVGISSCDKVLDLCCGYGRAGRWFSERWKASVIALDLVIFQLRILQTRAIQEKSEIQTVCADGGHLPFSNECVDLVWCEDGFSHIPARRGLLGECRRVLRPSGVLAFSDLLSTGRLDSLDELAFGKAWCLAPLETVESYQCLLKDLDFELLGVEMAGPEMLAVHEKCDQARGDATYEEYTQWLESVAPELIDVWGEDGYQTRWWRLQMYPFLRSGDLEQGYFVAIRRT